MPGLPEGARAVRAEDAFDVAQLHRWLRHHIADEFADAVSGAASQLAPQGLPEVHQFGGGASNLTFLVRYPKQDFIVRTPPRGTKAAGAHDMAREYTFQSALAPGFGYVARMAAHCADPSVIGAEFYVMERLDGMIPRAKHTEADISADQASTMCEAMVDVLAKLHSVDISAVGLQTYDRGPGYVERQVAGWSSRYRNAATEDAPDCEPVMRWLAQHQPPDRLRCVIHNDFKMDNIVFSHDLGSIVGVLDWEMATVGDPLMDLGGDLAFWTQADDSEEFQLFRRVPTHLPGMMTRRDFVSAYCGRVGISVSESEWKFYEVFGIFRLAVIAQQIYYRYFHKQTSNEMYALFGPVAHIAYRRIEALLSWA